MDSSEACLCPLALHTFLKGVQWKDDPFHYRRCARLAWWTPAFCWTISVHCCDSGIPESQRKEGLAVAPSIRSRGGFKSIIEARYGDCWPASYIQRSEAHSSANFGRCQLDCLNRAVVTSPSRDGMLIIFFCHKPCRCHRRWSIHLCVHMKKTSIHKAEVFIERKSSRGRGGSHKSCGNGRAASANGICSCGGGGPVRVHVHSLPLAAFAKRSSSCGKKFCWIHS